MIRLEPGPRCLVAVFRDGQILVSDDGAIPEIADSRWPTPAELLVAVPGVRAIQAAPTFLVAQNPRVTLHVFRALDKSVPGRWVDAGSLDLPELALVLRAMTQPPARRPDWFRSGWLDEAVSWIDERLAAVGRSRTGDVEVIKIWSLSAVLSAPTDTAGYVYFKATCDWFGAEPAITTKLGEIFPGLVTAVLAVNPVRRWMLMASLPTAVAAQGFESADQLCEIAVLAADLHLKSVKFLPELVAVGCPDRTLPAMCNSLTALAVNAFELPLLTDLEREALAAAVPQLLAELSEFAECGIPWTLVHGDLHSDNVAHSKDGSVFFDWTDACISHPFLDLVLLTANASESERVQRAYFACWRAALPTADIERAWKLAPRINWIFQVISYEGILRTQEDASTWELGGIQADYLRKILAPDQH